MTKTTVQRSQRAFTLIEILIVVAVVAILIGLLMPAMQAVRESARLGQCRNHCRQMALACVQHNEVYGVYPLCPKWYGYMADPDLGNGMTPVVTPDYPNGEIQNGGWQYNILPYLDQLEVHQYGAGTSGATKQQWKSVMARVLIPTYSCAARGEPRIYSNGATYANVTTSYIQRSDFSGSRGTGSGMLLAPPGRRHSEVADGVSNVFLLGHRYWNSLDYRSPAAPCNNASWPQGYDWDNQSYTGAANPEWGNIAQNVPPGGNYNPLQDTRSMPSCGEMPAGAPWTWGWPTGTRFGSPHAVLPMAMADGSVHSVNYDIDKTLFHVLGNVADGGVLPTKQ